MIYFLWDYLEGVPGAVTLDWKASLRFLNFLVAILILLPHLGQGLPPTWEGGPSPKRWRGIFGALRQSGWSSLHTQVYTENSPHPLPKHVLLTLTRACASLGWPSLPSPVRRFSFPFLGPPDAGGRIKSAKEPERKRIGTCQNKLPSDHVEYGAFYETNRSLTCAYLLLRVSEWVEMAR